MEGEITTHLDRLKESFLWAAAKGGRIQECASLLDLGALPDWTSPTPQRRNNNINNSNTSTDDSSFSLSAASLSSRQQNYDDEDTPLLVSVRSGHKDVASLLLAHGADPTKIGRGRNNILHLAASKGDEELCRLILSNLQSTQSVGRLLRQKNATGKTPLEVATEESGSVHVAAIMAQWIDQSYYNEEEEEEDSSEEVEEEDYADNDENNVNDDYLSTNSASTQEYHEAQNENDLLYYRWDDQQNNNAVGDENEVESYDDEEGSEEEDREEEEEDSDNNEDDEDESPFNERGMHDGERERLSQNSTNNTDEKENEAEHENDDGNYNENENVFPIHSRLRSMFVADHPLVDNGGNQNDGGFVSQHCDHGKEESEPDSETTTDSPDQDDDALVDALRSLAIRLRSENETLKESERAANVVSTRTESDLLVSVAECAKLQRENVRLTCLLQDYFLNDIISCHEDDESEQKQRENKSCGEKKESRTVMTAKKKTLKELENIEEHLRMALQRASSEKEKEAKRIMEEEEDKRCCVICQTEAKSVLLMPCRHLCVCAECGQRPELDRCPLCREMVEQRISVYS